jgi:hypothetical protein
MVGFAASFAGGAEWAISFGEAFFDGGGEWVILRESKRVISGRLYCFALCENASGKTLAIIFAIW